MPLSGMKQDLVQLGCQGRVMRAAHLAVAGQEGRGCAFKNSRAHVCELTVSWLIVSDGLPCSRCQALALFGAFRAGADGVLPLNAQLQLVELGSARAQSAVSAKGAAG